jgi:hypothetical protein
VDDETPQPQAGKRRARAQAKAVAEELKEKRKADRAPRAEAAAAAAELKEQKRAEREAARTKKLGTGTKAGRSSPEESQLRTAKIVGLKENPDYPLSSRLLETYDLQLKLRKQEKSKARRDDVPRTNENNWAEKHNIRPQIVSERLCGTWFPA